jgi:hypothetical protein
VDIAHTKQLLDHVREADPQEKRTDLLMKLLTDSNLDARIVHQ